MRPLFRLFGYLRPYAGQMVAAAILLALSGALMSLIVATMRPLVNEVFLGSPRVESAATAESAPTTGPDILAAARSWLSASDGMAWLRQRAFVAVPVLILLVFLVRGVFLYLGQYLTAKVGASVIRNLRAELYEAITRQSLNFFDRYSSGTLLSRVFSDVQRLQRISTVVLADLVRVSAMVPFLIIVVLVHDWRMSLMALVVLPLLVYSMVQLGRRLRGASRASQESMAEASSLFSETVTGVQVVQAFAMEEYETARFRDALSRVLRADLKAGRAAALASPLLELLGAMTAAALFFIAGLAIAKGLLDPGNFAVVLSGLGLLFLSARRLNRVNVEMQQALAAADRVFEILDLERDVVEAPSATPLAGFESDVRIEGVDFAYGGERVLNGIDLTIRKGEVVALVGPSGSGKTTLAKLIPRFYDPTAGKILVDGHDIRTATLSSVRALVGLVTQETVLFADTLRNNITYGSSQASTQRLEQVARAAQVDEFAARLTDGYDSHLGERGTRLSMGQRQRISIARALLRDAPILILDEATSALDSESERLVQDALENLLRGRTSIVIAHRLSTVRSADRIVVMQRGRIVEEGSHSQLLAGGGLYSDLYNLQFHEPEDETGKSGTPSS